MKTVIHSTAVAFLLFTARAECEPSYPAAAPRFGFMTLPGKPATQHRLRHAPRAQLTQWSSSFTDLTGKNVSYTMAGADPSISNTTTTIRVVIIPVVMIYGATNGNMTFDPTKARVHGKKNVIQNTLASPLFDNGYDFTSGAVDLGQAQYTDAFQRGNFWSHVSANTSYHTVLEYIKVKHLEPLTLSPTTFQGQVRKNGSGVVGTMDLSDFDNAVVAYLRRNNTKITPDILPLFLSYDIYLTCCGEYVGGYHSFQGVAPTSQTYAYATYDDTPGAFAEDIDAISHELAEWMDDPLEVNLVNCTDNKLMEVGDPLAGLPNYGTFSVKLNGFTYHPQSLVYIPYFGAPTNTSANGWIAFHNDITNVCPGQ